MYLMCSGLPLGDHRGRNAGRSADLFIAFGVVDDGAPEPVLGLVKFEGGKLIVQTADNIQVLRVEVAFGQAQATWLIV